MRAADFRDSIFFEWRLARQIKDLIQDLNEVQPDVLHFSGHGNSAELTFEDEGGQAAPLENEQMKRLLNASPKRIRLVVFNSCNSLAQATIAVNHVDITIGTDAAIGDAEAQTFAGQFYNHWDSDCLPPRLLSRHDSKSKQSMGEVTRFRGSLLRMG
jgi:hypothetical protein